MKKTKILCTLGPSSNSREMIDKLIVAGMDAARFNFSHGSHEGHLKVLKTLRELEEKHGKPIAAIADLQGPKIRVGRFADGPVELKDGQTFTITTRDIPGNSTIVSTCYEHLPKDVEPDERLLLADGLLEFKVTKVTDTDIECIVIHGGTLSNNKGINLPETQISAPSLTEKDIVDLEFAIEHDFDCVALSFVRKPQDITDAKLIIHKAGKTIPVIAKIERAEAVESINDIIDCANGIMIARGDLGVELPPENVPVIQKQILKECNAQGVFVITATQMLESMTENARPTRAEASDVANAIFDGTDAVMLSGETASGKFPVEAVNMMTRIAEKAEESRIDNIPNSYTVDPLFSVEDGIALASVQAAKNLNAKAIAVYTISGITASRVRKYRPHSPIYAFTPNEKTARRLTLLFGIVPMIAPIIHRFDDLFETIESRLAHLGVAKRGDILVTTAGIPLAKPGTTNTVKVHRVSEGELGVERISSFSGVSVDRNKCTTCGLCVRICPEAIFEIVDDKIYVSSEKAHHCLNDKMCEKVCPFDAISLDVDK